MAASVEKPHVEIELDSEEDMSEISENDERSEEEESEDGSDEEERSAGDGSEGEEEENVKAQDGEVDMNPNAGWADVMAKILGKKTPEDKPCILLKNKQRDKLNAKERKEKAEKKKQADKKRAWEMMCRVKPDVVQDKEKERNLQRVATRGVVQLFNAVRQHQKNVDEKMKEVGGSERKKAKVLSSVSKKDFIDVLRGTAGCNKAAIKNEKASSEVQKEKKPAWSVLRDDFMMGSSMKDWDKESDPEERHKEPGDAEDSDSD
ncbi:RRP15-like protein isoform X1 [Tachysurus fulvidraco]|uniref:RRP15-like protein isoform X1 n=1 Tax=Tachysurus fulvidraco TaxID=1234273 RepID=UPI001FED371D|nr:RRP15-like protein isoform X1 [Tachysurus fulvidraco]